MRPLVISLLAAVAMLTVMTTVAVAAKPSGGCPAAASGYFLVDRDLWWEHTVAGFEAEGIDVYEDDGVTFTAEFDQFAADFGLIDGAGLEDFVRNAQWEAFDHDADGWTCMKPRHASSGNGNPAYFFNGIDDRSAAQR